MPSRIFHEAGGTLVSPHHNAKWVADTHIDSRFKIIKLDFNFPTANLCLYLLKQTCEMPYMSINKAYKQKKDL